MPQTGRNKGGRDMAELFQFAVWLSVGTVLALLLLVPALATAAVCLLYLLWDLFIGRGRGRAP